MNTQGIGWRNENSYRHYPFVDDADLTMSGGTLPGDAVIDLHVVIYGDLYANNALTQDVWLHKVINHTTYIAVHWSVGSYAAVMSVPLSADLAEPITVRSSVPGTNGVKFTVTALYGASILTLAAPGGQSVPYTPIRILPSLVTVQSHTRVNSVRGAGPGGSEELTGRVYCQEGYNCQLEFIPGSVPVLRLGAVYGAGAGVPCTAFPDVRSCNDTLLRINGLTASTEGDFMIEAGPGVSVTPDPDTHTVRIKGYRPATKVGCQNVT